MKKQNDPLALFNVLRAKETNNASCGNNQNFGNPNVFKLKQGASYSLRLLWIPPADDFDREYPMINQYVHRIWDENAIGSKDVKVYCRTSQYDLGETKAGFACPMCKVMSETYKEGENGSKSAQELYKKFRRTLQGYVPVYVVNGPQEEIHQIKILQFTKSFKDFFDLKIFGIKKENPKKEDGEDTQDVIDEDMIGIDAFMYYNPQKDEVVTNGYNFIVTVKTKRIPINGKMVDVPDYKFDFSRKMSDVTDFDGEPITPERFINISNEISFDKDFYKFSTDEEIEEFKAKYIDGVSYTSNEVEEESKDDTETPMEKLQKAKTSKVKAEEVVKEEPKEEPEEDNVVEENEDESVDDIVTDVEENTEEEDEEIDIDDLLKGI